MVDAANGKISQCVYDEYRGVKARKGKEREE